MWPVPQETAYLVTFTEEILNGKLHFLWNVLTPWYAHILLSIRRLEMLIFLENFCVHTKWMMPSHNSIISDVDGLVWIVLGEKSCESTKACLGS